MPIQCLKDATVGQLRAALARHDWEKFEEIWQQAPRKIRQSSNMIAAYVSGLISQDKLSEAAKLIEKQFA